MIGLSLGLALGGRGAPGRTLEFVAANGANGETMSVTGVLAGDLIVQAILKGTLTAPVHDPAGGDLLGSWSSNASSAILTWKYAESATPGFGTHTGGSRCQFWAFRFSAPPADPIGALTRISGTSGTTLSWAGLTLERPGGHVLTISHRAANEAIVQRPGALSVPGAAGASARYQPMRSNGPVLAWAQSDVTQAVAGVYQSIAVEIGYP